MSELKKLTRLGSDTKKIAALLQAKAPKGHVLAYISPKEAAVLKARGGSGKPHGDTGILSFENELDTSYGGYDIQGGQDFVPPEVPIDVTEVPTFTPDIQVTPQVAGPSVTAPQFADISPITGAGPEILGSAVTPGATPGELAALRALPVAPEKEEGIADKLAKTTGLSKETLARLGLAGGLGMVGAGTARRAGEAGRAGATQMQALAQPYQQAGQALQAQAQRGELTPAALQSLQAVQAQAAQGVERRGGVGVAQAQQQVEAFRQQLLQQQYDYGLKLSGIGDNIALGAIKTGMQADQYVNQLTNSFYTNMAYIASGMTPGIRIGGNP